MFVTEIIGISLIWAGYRAMTKTQTVSVHSAASRAVTD
jgi:hypothetical protein